MLKIIAFFILMLAISFLIVGDYLSGIIAIIVGFLIYRLSEM